VGGGGQDRDLKVQIPPPHFSALLAEFSAEASHGGGNTQVFQSFPNATRVTVIDIGWLSPKVCFLDIAIRLRTSVKMRMVFVECFLLYFCV